MTSILKEYDLIYLQAVDDAFSWFRKKFQAGLLWNKTMREKMGKVISDTKPLLLRNHLNPSKVMTSDQVESHDTWAKSNNRRPEKVIAF